MSDQNENEVDPAASYLADPALEQAWGEAKEPPKRGDRLPDGKYTLVGESAKVVPGKDNIGFKVAWRFRVLMPTDHSRRVVFKDSKIEAGDALSYLKAELRTCGIEIGTPRELPTKLREFRGRVVNCTLRTGSPRPGTPPNADGTPARGYQSCYIDALVTAPGATNYDEWLPSIEHALHSEGDDTSFDPSSMGAV